MRSIFFHEDDYGLIELLPLSNWEHCVSQMRSIAEFSDAHWTGAGWTDIYVGQKAPHELSALGIKQDEIKAALEPLLRPYDNVTTGYGTQREACPQVLAWGNSSAITVFAGFNAEKVVRSLWFAILTLNESEAQEAKRALMSLPKAEEVLLADWTQYRLVRLTQEQEIDDYLKTDEDDD